MQKEPSQVRVTGYLVFWIVILLGFAAIGFRGYLHPPYSPKAEGTGPDCSSDGFLSEALRVSGGSRKLMDAFSQIPSRRPMVVFWPGINPNAVISAQMVGYLSWPREVWSVSMDDHRIAKATTDFRAAPFSAIIYYILKPPAPAPGAKVIGPMTIVPLVGNSK